MEISFRVEKMGTKINIVFYILIANVIVTESRNVLPNRRYVELLKSQKRMDATEQTQVGDTNIYFRNHKDLKEKGQTHLNKIVGDKINFGNQNEKGNNKQVNAATQEIPIMNPTMQTDREQISRTTIVPSRRLVSPYQSQQNRPVKPTMITRQGERTTEFYRSTSEDLLRWLLKQKLPTDHPAPEQVGVMPEGIMLPVTQPLWIFEDYDDAESISDVLRDEVQDCENQRIHCTQDTENSIPVCVSDLSIPVSVGWQARQKGFNSFCEVNYRNCLKRYERTGKYYSDHYTEEYLEFIHYGWCKICQYFPDRTCV